jgi:hypothetical protein
MAIPAGAACPAGGCMGDRIGNAMNTLARRYAALSLVW